MRIVFSRQAVKDYEKIKGVSSLRVNVGKLLALLKEEPLRNPPQYEKLTGNLEGAYSRRINKQHRLVYEIVDKETVKILRMWTRYE